MFANVWWSESPRKGDNPETRMYVITPTAHISRMHKKILNQNMCFKYNTKEIKEVRRKLLKDQRRFKKSLNSYAYWDPFLK